MKIYGTVTFSSMNLGRVFAQLSDKNKANDAARAALQIIFRKTKIS